MEKLNLDNHLQVIKNRKPQDNARNYIESILLPYLPEFRWENTTLEKDMATFYILVYKYNKHHTIYQFQKLLDWAKGKNLYPRQFMKLLSK